MRKFFIWIQFVGECCKVVGGVADGCITAYDQAKEKIKAINDAKQKKEDDRLREDIEKGLVKRDDVDAEDLKRLGLSVDSLSTTASSSVDSDGGGVKL